MPAAGKPATAVWASWSPGSDNRTKIHRRFVQVPSDQQKLLDRADLAWVPRGFPNVPPGVLEDVKTHNAKGRRPRTPVEREALSSQPPSPVSALSSQAVSLYQAGIATLSPHSAPPAQATAVHEESNGTSIRAAGDSNGEEVASESPIPWTPSPSSHFGPPIRQQELPTASGSPSRNLSGQDDRRAGGHTLARAPIVDFPPSSSAASGPVLEIEVPKAITDVLGPVDHRLAAVLEPTPPSAQVIPCTNTDKTSPAQAPKTQRRRRMKQFPAAILAGLDPAGRGNVSGVAPPEATAGAPSRPPSPDVSPSSPISGPPGTDLALAAPGDGKIPASGKQPGTAASTSQLVDKQVSSNPSIALPRNGPPSQAPFIAFTFAYPDYKGSLGDFIRGVMCILQLQKDRALNEFLYDDFVRVFSGDYLDYIMTVAHDQSALPAVQFYNLNVPRPLYTKGVLTKDNVKDVANQYPEKTLAIQHILEEVTPETGPRSRPTRQAPGRDKTATQRPPVPTETARSLRQNGLPSAMSFMDSGLMPQNTELLADSIPMTSQPRPAREHRGAVRSPENSVDNWGLSAATPPRRKDPKSTRTADTTAPNSAVSRTSIDSSQSDAIPSRTPQVMKTQLPVASTVPSGTALSNPDSIPEVTLKRKARTSTASSAAGKPGAEFKRPRLTQKDAEKRAQRFKRFLLRKQTQSSAPEGSTPS